MKLASHIAYLVLAATLSLAPAQATPLRLYEWVAVKDLPTPTASMTMKGGASRSLADFKGRVVLLNLWATWCPPCLKELPTLDLLEQEYAGKGLVVLPLSVDRDKEWNELRALLDEGEVVLPHLALDGTGDIQRDLEPRGLPVSYLIDRDGKILERYEGASNWMMPSQQEKIRAALERK